MGGGSVGIDVVAVAESRVAGNTVDRVGPIDGGREEIGIAVRGFARSQIDGNASRRYPPDPDFDPAGGRFIGLLVGSFDERDLELGFTTAGGITTGLGTKVFGLGEAAAVGFARITAPAVTVDTNVVAGGAADAPAAVIVGLRGDAIVTSNHAHGNQEFGTTRHVGARRGGHHRAEPAVGRPGADRRASHRRPRCARQPVDRHHPAQWRAARRAVGHPQRNRHLKEVRNDSSLQGHPEVRRPSAMNLPGAWPTTRPSALCSIS